MLRSLPLLLPSLPLFAAPVATGADEPAEVLVVVADDLGWDLYRRAPTPNLDALAADGVLFTQFWVTPFCAPTRASLLTGRFHFRIGDGEIARRHKRRTMNLAERILPELLAPEHSAAFGKWHLSTEPDHPNRSGFGTFVGTLRNLNHQSYSRWNKVRNGVVEPCEVYATTEITNEAIRSPARFEYVAYHAPHAPMHDPPRELTPQRPSDGTPEGQLLAMTEALDTEIGRLARAHPGAWLFVLGDNGSVPAGGKGSLREKGIHVPLIVRPPQGADAEGEPWIRGRSDALVHVVDLYATIAELWGVDARTEDSISFLPVLRGAEGARTWNYTCVFPERRPDERFEAVRDRDYKLVVHRDGTRSAYRLPGEEELDLERAEPQVRARIEALEARRRSLHDEG